MIAKSDFTILALASALLAFGLFRAYGQAPQNLASNYRPSSTANAVKTARTPSTQVLPAVKAPTGNVAVTQPTDSDDVVVNIATNQAASVSAFDNSIDSQNKELVFVEASAQIDQSNPPADAEGVLLMVHTVKSGEYLSLLAKRYNTTVETLQELNLLSGTTIQIGQDLIYPSSP